MRPTIDDITATVTRPSADEILNDQTAVPQAARTIAHRVLDAGYSSREAMEAATTFTASFTDDMEKAKALRIANFQANRANSQANH